MKKLVDISCEVDVFLKTIYPTMVKNTLKMQPKSDNLSAE